MTKKPIAIVTGGAGFIGSHLVRLLVNKYPKYHIINLDLLTYAGNLENLKDIENYKNYHFVREDICDFYKMKTLFKEYEIEAEFIHEFLKNRFNNSLESIGIEKVFDVDEDLVAQTEWFDDEIIGTKHGDFFVKRSINYSKRSQSITSDDLF